MACRPGLGEFFLKSGLADEIVEVDKKSGEGRARALSRMRSEVWDWVFVPHESPRTALWMARVRARKGKVGFHKWWNVPFFTKRVHKPMDLPDALRQLSLLAAVDSRIAENFGSEDVQELANVRERAAAIDFSSPEIPEWASMAVKANRPSNERVIYLAPGSVWPTKRWILKGYKELAKLLLARGFRVELVGSRDEKDLCDEVAASVPGTINRCGETSLAGLVDLFSRGTALICNDSGAMHAAAAAGLPTVAVFGPTVLDFGFRPWQNRALVVQRDLPCRPCAAHGGMVCPIGTHECMESISAVEVMAALDKLLVG